MDLLTQLKNMHMLLIDDDQWVRDSLWLFLESEGCKVVALETAEEGLKFAANYQFDIIIVDYRLPGMDGLEFIKRLPDSQSNSLKVLISAYGSEDLLASAKKAGVHQFIPKPFDTGIIKDSLNRLITDRNNIA